MAALYSSFFALMMATALVPLLAAKAGRLGLLDLPDARKIHRRSIPRVGGIAIAAGTLLSVILWFPLRPEVLGYVLGGLTIAIFGVADDRYNLDYRVKFFGQIGAALTFVLVGGVHLSRMPFVFDGVLPSELGLPLTIVALVGVTNAVNLSDGMDGLAGGTSLLASGALGYMAYLGGDLVTALVALSLMGATLGFLRYNTHPAQVFMGDAGSQFLGFSVAALGLILVERSNTAISPLVPVLVLCLPILDTLYVMVRRILEGRSPFSPDRRHLHHRLLDAGLSQQGAVVLIYSAQIILVVLAFHLRYAADEVLLLALIGFSTLIFAFMNGLARTSDLCGEDRDRVSCPGTPRWCRRAVEVIGNTARAMVRYGVVALLPFVAFGAAKVPEDIAWLNLLLLVALGATLRLGLLSRATIDRLASFAAAVISVFLANNAGFSGAAGSLVFHAVLVLLAIGVALWLRFAAYGNFRVNALDVLLVMIVAVAPTIPALRESGYALVIVETLLLFYACELVLSDRRPRWDSFRISTLACLGVLVIRGLL